MYEELVVTGAWWDYVDVIASRRLGPLLWALRQYAWTNPREVCRYVKEHRHVLSPLTKREALKNALASGLITSVP